MQKAERLRRLEDTYQRALATLEDADPELVVYEETGWRVKDIVAHVATWDAETLRSLYAYRRGGEYVIENYVDHVDFGNFAARARYYEPMAQIMADWDATVKWLHILANTLTPDDFAAEMTYPSGERGQVGALLEDICEHREAHLNEIREALKIG